MNADVKAKWVAALRSGKYQQAQGHLAVPDFEEPGEMHYRYCCLGVLCELAVAEGVIQPPLTDDATYDGEGELYYGPQGDRNSTGLPQAVIEWAGLTPEQEDPQVRRPEGAPTNPHFSHYEKDPDRTTLASLNDGAHFTFEQIADVIEEQL